MVEKVSAGAKWSMLINSIIKAASLLGYDYSESDLPEYGQWDTATKMKNSLWNKVNLRRKNKK